jgi:hypothetical protein
VKKIVANCQLKNGNCKLNHSLPSPFGRGPGGEGRVGANWVAIVLFVFIAGCGTKSAITTETEKNSESQPAISVVENGPVKLTVEVNPAKARLSDEPVLTLTIDAERGVEIDKPPFGDELGGFKIVDSREPLAKTREGREIYERILTLEPTVTGKLSIDPISVTFRDKRSGADGKPQSLATKPLAVEVVSAYTKETPSLADLRASADPLALPWFIPVWCWVIIAVAILLAMFGVVLWRRREREKAAMAVILSPEELARLEMQKLAASGWMESDVKLYFVELTAIVRRYIERTTGIRAPEQTTEEFLREISRASSLLAKGEGILSDRLKDFLESADLVKFAAFRPRHEDIEESFRRAEVFIGLRLREPAAMPQEAPA